MLAMFRCLKLLTLAAVLALPVQAAPAEGNRCFEDWSDAAPIMLKEGLLATKEVHEQARRRFSGDLLRITLCQEGDRYVYRLLMRDRGGHLSQVTVDARHPFDR